MSTGRADVPSDDTKKRQTIQSVSRAARILLTIARSRSGMNATEVAEAVGLTISTTYHLLATLEDETLLRKTPGKRYTLGTGAAEITNSPSLQARVDPRHRQALSQLAAVTRETAYLTGWFRGEIRILATVEGSQAVRVAGLEVGHTGDVHARASAKVLLAFADAEVRSQVLDGQEFTRFTTMTVTDRNTLESQFDEIRRLGLHYDRGEYREDVRSLSVPIRQDGRVVAALAITAPAERYQRTEKELVEAILAAAAFADDGN